MSGSEENQESFLRKFGNTLICSLCTNGLHNSECHSVVPCMHSFCQECLSEHIETSKIQSEDGDNSIPSQPCCPIDTCSQPIQKLDRNRNFEDSASKYYKIVGELKANSLLTRVESCEKLSQTKQNILSAPSAEEDDIFPVALSKLNINGEINSIDSIANGDEIKDDDNENGYDEFYREGSVAKAFNDEMFEKCVECGICMGVVIKASTLSPCLHTFCAKCISDWHSHLHPSCPLCRTFIDTVHLNPHIDQQALLYLQHFPNLKRHPAEVSEWEDPLAATIRYNHSFAQSQITSDAIIDAVKLNNITELTLLLNNMNDTNIINQVNSEGRTALVIACDIGHDECVKLLLQYRANTEITDDGKTALIWACDKGNAECCRLLMEAGAYKDVKSFFGVPALCFAAGRGYDQCIQIFINHHANLNVTNNEGVTALMYAIDYWHPSCVQLLACNGADVQCQMKSGYTILSKAISKRDFPLIHSLIESSVCGEKIRKLIPSAIKVSPSLLSSFDSLNERVEIEMIEYLLPHIHEDDVNLQLFEGITMLEKFIQQYHGVKVNMMRMIRNELRLIPILSNHDNHHHHLDVAIRTDAFDNNNNNINNSNNTVDDDDDDDDDTHIQFMNESNNNSYGSNYNDGNGLNTAAGATAADATAASAGATAASAGATAMHVTPAATTVTAESVDANTMTIPLLPATNASSASLTAPATGTTRRIPIMTDPSSSLSDSSYDNTTTNNNNNNTNVTTTTTTRATGGNNHNIYPSSASSSNSAYSASASSSLLTSNINQQPSSQQQQQQQQQQQSLRVNNHNNQEQQQYRHQHNNHNNTQTRHFHYQQYQHQQQQRRRRRREYLSLKPLSEVTLYLTMKKSSFSDRNHHRDAYSFNRFRSNDDDDDDDDECYTNSNGDDDEDGIDSDDNHHHHQYRIQRQHGEARHESRLLMSQYPTSVPATTITTTATTTTATTLSDDDSYNPISTIASQNETTPAAQPVKQSSSPSKQNQQQQQQHQQQQYDHVKARQQLLLSHQKLRDEKLLAVQKQFLSIIMRDEKQLEEIQCNLSNHHHNAFLNTSEDESENESENDKESMISTTDSSSSNTSNNSKGNPSSQKNALLTTTTNIQHFISTIIHRQKAIFDQSFMNLNTEQLKLQQQQLQQELQQQLAVQIDENVLKRFNYVRKEMLKWERRILLLLAHDNVSVEGPSSVAPDNNNDDDDDNYDDDVLSSMHPRYQQAHVDEAEEAVEESIDRSSPSSTPPAHADTTATTTTFTTATFNNNTATATPSLLLSSSQGRLIPHRHEQQRQQQELLRRQQLLRSSSRPHHHHHHHHRFGDLLRYALSHSMRSVIIAKRSALDDRISEPSPSSSSLLLSPESSSPVSSSTSSSPESSLSSSPESINQTSRTTTATTTIIATNSTTTSTTITATNSTTTIPSTAIPSGVTTIGGGSSIVIRSFDDNDSNEHVPISIVFNTSSSSSNNSASSNNSNNSTSSNI